DSPPPCQILRIPTRAGRAPKANFGCPSSSTIHIFREPNGSFTAMLTLSQFSRANKTKDDEGVRRHVRVISYIPPPPLADFVELLWLHEGAAPAHARERILPTGTTELVVPLGADSGEPVISGAHSESFVIETAVQSAIMGVHFRPGG